jgi:hypothetical protein
VTVAGQAATLDARYRRAIDTEINCRTREATRRYTGLNYALVLSAWRFAGLIGPTLLARVKDLTWSYVAILPTIALLLLVSAILPFFTREPAAATSAHSVEETESA